MSADPKSIVIAAGGTAGHVNPALALARVLARERVTFIGTPGGLEARLVQAAGWSFEAIVVRGFDRARPLSLATTGITAVRATRAAARVVRRLQADVVVGMGGYVSLPVCLAARAAGIPVVVHEQNLVLGLANRIAKRFARRVGVSFEETLERAGERAVFVGNPVGEEMSAANASRCRPDGLARFDLDPQRPTLLVFGGSGGARRINMAAGELASLWAERADRQVVHITGSAADRAGSAPERTGDLVWRRLGFVDRMIDAYAVADLAVCRGGATTIAELTAVGIPSIIVPYPHHRDRQQELHARVLERAGAAVVVPDEAASGTRLAQEADRLLERPERLEEMRHAASALGVPDAAERLARVVRETAA